MDSQSATHDEEFLREVGDTGNSDSGKGLGNVFCKCGEGWTCVITRIVAFGPVASKFFFKSGENCTCSIDGEAVSQEKLKAVGDVASGAYYNCGEGWSCVISKIEAPDAPKGFECAGPCNCTIDAK